MVGPNTNQTHSMASKRRLLLFVRYKPSMAESDATGMVDSVAGSVAGAISTVESAVSNIPGLNMFIKEDKAGSKSEKEYKYEYKELDAKKSEIQNLLSKVLEENKVDVFEFSSTDSDGRKDDGKALLDKIKSLISSWNNYPAQVNLVGIGQGGNVINECLNLIAGDSAFVKSTDDSDAAKTKWSVKSVFYVATPLYKDKNKIDDDKKPKGCRFISVFNKYDLTQNAIDFFDPSENLNELIKKYDSNTLSFMIGHIRMRVIKILAILLDSINLDTGDTANMKKQLDKLDRIKSEVEGLMNDIIGLVKDMIDQFKSLAQLSDLPQFDKMLEGYDKIPDEAVGILTKELDSNDKDHPGLIQRILDMAKSGSLDFEKADIGRFLNCLNPLLEALTKSLQQLKFGTASQTEMIDQIIKSIGEGTKIYEPATLNPGTQIDISPLDKYHDKVINKAKTEKIADLALAYIARTQSAIKKAAAKESDLSKLTGEEKTELAQCILAIVNPLFVSKAQVLDKLIEPIRGLDFLNEFLKDDRFKALLGKAGDLLGKISLKFSPSLQTNIDNVNGEINRLIGTFKKADFKLQDDPFYFIFNTHNLAINSLPPALLKEIYNQTDILYIQKQDNNIWDDASGTFVQQGPPKENVQPVAVHQPL